MTSRGGSLDPRLEVRAPIRVWDRSTRLFHWALVALLISAYCTRNFVSDPTLYLHRLNGYAILVLLLFRLFWGVVGSSTSRFASFFPWPGSALRYAGALVRGRKLVYLGHNPLGAALIFLMLLAVATQATTGLFTSDDAIAQGPLFDHVSEAVSGRAASYHAKGFWIIIALAAVHIVANVTYQFGFGDKLISAMITGNKAAGDYADSQQPRFAPAWRAALCLAVSLCVVAGVVLASGDSLLR